MDSAAKGTLRTARLAIGALAVAHVASLTLAADGPFDSFLIGLLAASALPYLLCLGVLKWTGSAGAALGGLIAIAVFDLWMYWSVFIAPRGSTAAIGLVFAPVWKLFILLPLGALIGRALEAWRARRDRGGPHTPR
jgi:hypothetical protein